MARTLALTVATVLCPLALFLSGCGGGAAEPAAGSSASVPETPQAAVVREFLQAVQEGNRDAASKRLTAQAVKAFEEHDVPFLPAAITSGSFQLGKTVESGRTHFVQCIWTDHDAAPGARSEKIQWMVKEDGGSGWRIFGLAVYMEEQGENMVINFEQPQELLLRRDPPQEQAATAGSAGDTSTAPAQQATLPQDPFQTAPR